MSTENFTCRHCDATFGIAGELATEQDWEAQDYFDEQVTHHLRRLCRNGQTPQSVLDAPRLRPLTISHQRGYSRQERRHGLRPQVMSKDARDAAHAEAVASGRNVPATATRERKVRKGRKARFNRSAA